MEVPAHFRGAAMGDGPDGTPLCLAHGVTVFTQMGGQEAAQRVDDGGCHGFPLGLAGLRADLTGKLAAELFDQGAAVLFAAVRQVEIDHGGIDVAMT